MLSCVPRPSAKSVFMPPGAARKPRIERNPSRRRRRPLQRHRPRSRAAPSPHAPPARTSARNPQPAALAHLKLAGAWHASILGSPSRRRNKLKSCPARPHPTSRQTASGSAVLRPRCAFPPGTSASSHRQHKKPESVGAPRRTRALPAERVVHPVRRNHHRASGKRHSHLPPMRRQSIPEPRSARNASQTTQHQQQPPPLAVPLKTRHQRQRSQARHQQSQRPVCPLLAWQQVRRHRTHRQHDRRQQAMHDACRRRPHSKPVRPQPRPPLHHTLPKHHPVIINEKRIAIDQKTCQAPLSLNCTPLNNLHVARYICPILYNGKTHRNQPAPRFSSAAHRTC